MKTKEIILQNKKQLRLKRIRAKISGTAKRPRLSATRTNRGFCLQLIDDVKGQTVAAVSRKDLPKDFKGTKVEQATKLGEILAVKAKDKKISQVVFDRRGSKFHGRIQALADSLKKNDIKI